MSLPSAAVFLDSDGNVIKRSYINCGWWFDDSMIPAILHDIKEGDGYPDEKWCKVLVYGIELTYDTASNLYNVEKLHRNIRDLKRFVSKFHDMPEYQLKELFETVIDLGSKLKELSSNRVNEGSSNENRTS